MGCAVDERLDATEGVSELSPDDDVDGKAVVDALCLGDTLSTPEDDGLELKEDDGDTLRLDDAEDDSELESVSLAEAETDTLSFPLALADAEWDEDAVGFADSVTAEEEEADGVADGLGDMEPESQVEPDPDDDAVGDALLLSPFESDCMAVKEPEVEGVFELDVEPEEVGGSLADFSDDPVTDAELDPDGEAVPVDDAV